MKLGTDYDEVIKDMYLNQNMTALEISKKIGCCSTAIDRILKRLGIKTIYRPRKHKLTDSQIIDIINRYESGETTAEIAKVYNMSDNSVAKILRNNNIQIRKSVRRSIIKNHDYFHFIDSVDKAYFLGWMASDGSVVRCKTRPDRSDIISIELKDDDRYIVELFARQLGASAESVKIYSKRGHCYFRFASQEMSNDLAKYNVVPNKTMRQSLPELPDDMMPHFIRGYFDGNGTITSSGGYKKFAFYGSQEICEQLSDHLHNKIGSNKTKISKSTCYHVWFNGEEVAKRFADYIYC